MVQLTTTYLTRKWRMTDKVTMHFSIAPTVAVVVTAPCIYVMEGALYIEYDFEGLDVQVFPYTALESLHINKVRVE